MFWIWKLRQLFRQCCKCHWGITISQAWWAHPNTAWFHTSKKFSEQYYAMVTPLRKAASSEPRIAILGISGDTWLTRGKYGIYVAVCGSYVTVRGSYGVYMTLLPCKISPFYCHVSYMAVTRIPSLVLRNTWHYVIIGAENFDFLNLSYVAHTRRLYTKVWPQH